MAEESGAALGKFGAAFGKGAAKIGKKAAQSEAGRRATSAAVKGACDGVRDDMVARYGTGSPPPEAPAPQPSTTTTEKKSESPSQPRASGGDSSSYSHEPNYSAPSTQSHSSVSRKRSGPPKPSLFDKLKFSSNKKNQPTRRRSKPPVNQRDKVFKSRLARTPDWDRLPLAQTLYNYKAERNCDLEFRKGQVIQVITRTDSQNDWWEGKLEGRVGIFPANYVQLM